MTKIQYLAAVMGLLTPGCWSQSQSASCADLKQLSTPELVITMASPVEAGMFTPVAAGEISSRKQLPAKVPAFCRVTGVLHPVAASNVGFEVWLPLPGAWNHKFEGVGNGAYAGRISYGPLENAVSLGYAAASTDTGHSGSELNFVAGHPERIDDWGYRAAHVTALAAKKVIAAYYGAQPQHAYFNGCSTGGSQALAEAQRFPDDYDGILAGDAGNDRVHLNVGFLWGWNAAHPAGELILPDDKLALLHQAALNACHAEHDVILDPASCHFDPGVLLCKGGQTTGCLASQQVDAARKIYAGPHNPRTGESIIAGMSVGSEVIHGGGDYAGWKNFITGPAEPSRLDFWKLWVFEDPRWDWHSFDYDRDVAAADKKMAAVNASSTDISAFRAHGGKLLMYHGWSDPVGPPGDAIRYYSQVAQRTGGAGATQSFFRLFMVPGMSHCNGGDGYQVAGGARGVDDPEGVPRWEPPDPEHDMLSALDRWVSQGTAPADIIAFHKTAGSIDRTIPVCPYPHRPVWNGKTSADEARSYTCKAPASQASAKPN
jgi:feruloyl esterase